MSEVSVVLPDIAVLGAGSMGRAVLGGLLAPDVARGEIRATTRTAASASELTGRGILALASEDDADANRKAVRGAGIVLAAVKPGGIVPVLREVAADLDPGALVVSVAAGISTSAMEEAVPSGVAVVRGMPNTPSSVGLGVTGLSAGSRAGEAEMALARALFEPVGEVVEVPEGQIDALSAFSGSGPAYVFYLIEQLTAAAVEKGFDPEVAARLVNGTFRGSVELLACSGQAPAELRRQVTSPGGTTAQAVAVLAESGLQDVFSRATSAAIARARELSAGA